MFFPIQDIFADEHAVFVLRHILEDKTVKSISSFRPQKFRSQCGRQEIKYSAYFILSDGIVRRVHREYVLNVSGDTWTIEELELVAKCG